MMQVLRRQIAPPPQVDTTLNMQSLPQIRKLRPRDQVLEAFMKPHAMPQDITSVNTQPRPDRDQILNALMQGIKSTGGDVAEGMKKMGNFLLEPMRSAGEGGMEIFEEVQRQQRQLRDPFGG